MPPIIIVLGIVFIIILLVSSIYNQNYGVGDVRVQFKREESGTSVNTGRGGSIGEAMADGFRKLYNGLSPNSMLDTIQSRYDIMEKSLSENRGRMFQKDIDTCESYIRRTKALLDHKKAQAAAKEAERAEAARLAREKRETAERLAREKQKALPAQRQFVAEQRRLMTDSLRYDVMRRDGFRCQICGAIAADGYKLHVDHIYPVSKGGKTEMSNLRTLCERCNMGKRDKIEEPPKVSESQSAPVEKLSKEKTPEEKIQGEKTSEEKDQKNRDPVHPTSYEAALKYLKDSQFEYVDKTAKGGSLYFFDKGASQHLKGAGYTVLFAKNGTKGTGNRPAWFVTAKQKNRPGLPERARK